MNNWIEEIFPESVDVYTKLKAKLAAAGMKTLIADGENLGDPEQFEPVLETEAAHGRRPNGYPPGRISGEHRTGESQRGLRRSFDSPELGLADRRRDGGCNWRKP